MRKRPAMDLTKVTAEKVAKSIEKAKLQPRPTYKNGTIGKWKRTPEYCKKNGELRKEIISKLTPLKATDPPIPGSMIPPKPISPMQQRLNELMPGWTASPILFIKDMWNLTPQLPLPEYATAVSILVDQGDYESIRSEWFQPFVKGLNYTWQQWLILLMVENAINHKASRRISVASGHCIGKSAIMSMLLIWHLFTHFQSQVACTAPTSRQMFDVLWKEVSIWISRMPKGWHSQFDRQSTYIRMTTSPDTWFASAKTAKKDSTEALQGVHGQHVLILADEASGIINEVFDAMEGSLTEDDYFVILFSNPTRSEGYFYETHHKMASKWQHVKGFSNIDSPLVRDDFNQDIIDRYGKDSDEYRIKVLGLFPKEGVVDDKGFTPLLQKADIRECDNTNSPYFHAPVMMGIDPAGEGRDSTVWVVRDQFKALIVAKERISDDISIAARTRTLSLVYKVKPENIYIDSFGVGSNVAAEIAKTWFKINAINVGDSCIKERDRDVYLNRKAQNYFRLRKALLSGFELVRNPSWRDELPKIKFKRNERNRIQIMSKKDYRKEYGNSPDVVEALMLSFSEDQGHADIRTFTKDERTPTNQNSTIFNNSTNNIYSAI